MKFFRYHQTNCFFIESSLNGKLLAIDAGWPCTFYEYQRYLKQINLRYQDIVWSFVTHLHMDHAGLWGEFIESNINCYAFEEQINHIDKMESIITRNKDYINYKRIDKSKIKILRVSESRQFFKEIGIVGEVISTKGHSKDSITFISDHNEAIIGDLYSPDLVMSDDIESRKSWEAIKEKGAKFIYPSHAKYFEI